jgi:hypothetical protein
LRQVLPAWPPRGDHLEDGDMAERVVKATGPSWRPWAITAALSIGCAALLFFVYRRAASRTPVDPYEEWWRRRDQIRANGEHNPHLFV